MKLLPKNRKHLLWHQISVAPAFESFISLMALDPYCEFDLFTGAPHGVFAHSPAEFFEHAMLRDFHTLYSHKV